MRAWSAHIFERRAPTIGWSGSVPNAGTFPIWLWHCRVSSTSLATPHNDTDRFGPANGPVASCCRQHALRRFEARPQHRPHHGGRYVDLVRWKTQKPLCFLGSTARDHYSEKAGNRSEFTPDLPMLVQFALAIASDRSCAALVHDSPI